MKKELNADSLQVSIRPTRNAIAREGGTVHIEVQLTPPAAQPRQGRRPVALALVIDRSGSMAGPAAEAPQPGAIMSTSSDAGYPDKLSFVKEASCRLLDLLQDGDLLSLVTFDDTVRVVKPMTRISATNRAALAAAIRGINTGGSTNIEGAIREGYAQFSDAIRGAHSCKLILLSDGEANVGEARPAVLGERAAGAAHNAVVTSTLGVGFDYNLALMAHLAEAGNGDFSHIEGLADLDRQLREELAGAAEVTASDVEVHVCVPVGAAAGTNLNCYPQRTEDFAFTVSLGDLVRPKSFIFELSTPVGLDGDTMLIEAVVEATDPAGNDISARTQVELQLAELDALDTSATDADLVRRVLGMIKVSALADASTLYDRGLAADASAVLKQSTTILDRAEAVYGDLARHSADLVAARRELDQMLESVEFGVLSSADTKRMYMTSSMVMQSRFSPDDVEDEA